MAELVADPVTRVEALGRTASGLRRLPHPAIPHPEAVYGAVRRNAAGVDLSDAHRLQRLAQGLGAAAQHAWMAGPMVAGASGAERGAARALCSPADTRDVVGYVTLASDADVDAALATACAAHAGWSAVPAVVRAARLDRAADLLQAQMDSLIGLLVREGGKTLGAAVGEVREAVDTLRYSAAHARGGFRGQATAPGAPAAGASRSTPASAVHSEAWRARRWAGDPALAPAARGATAGAAVAPSSSGTGPAVREVGGWAGAGKGASGRASVRAGDGADNVAPSDPHEGPLDPAVQGADGAASADAAAPDLAAVCGASDAASRGPIVCISPWNFPLAIFCGQVAAALAAGNAVLAKPATQTPLVAAQAVRLLHAAGIPPGVLQLLPGAGSSVGARLVADARIAGVMFTGSTAVAHGLQRALAGRLDARGLPLLLVAETGGINAMVVDSSALPEQVVADVLASAFDSAGQRCSALRLLCVQHEVADTVLRMLEGAMQELCIGAPGVLATDVGPVIDAAAAEAIAVHVGAQRAAGRRVRQVEVQGALPHGHVAAPTLIEIARVDSLRGEVFGPVLHVLRYERAALPELLEQINALGYGLTFGLHTRIDATAATVTAAVRAGNQYVNRNMIGAVVGAQPFGGEGLSGTGPKAGGPLYARRLLCNPPPIDWAALPGAQRQADRERQLEPLRALRAWAQERLPRAGEGAAQPSLAALCGHLESASPLGWVLQLPGPTGERNAYRLVARGVVACAADDVDALLVQLAHVMAGGSVALWPDHAAARALAPTLPRAVQCGCAGRWLEASPHSTRHWCTATLQRWWRARAGWRSATAPSWGFRPQRPALTVPSSTCAH